VNHDRIPVAFFLLVACAAVLVGFVLYPLWEPLFLGAVLATALSRPYERLVLWLRGRRGLSATLVTVGCILLLLGPIGSIVVIAARQALEALIAAREAFETQGLSELINRLPGPLVDLLTRLRELAPAFDLKELNTELPDKLVKGSQWAASVAGGALRLTSQVAFNAAIMLITMHVLLVDGRRFVTWLVQVSPLHRAETHALLIEFKQATRAILTSTLATAGAQGLLATIGYLIAGAPRPIFFGLLTMLCAFIPGVGTALVGVPLIAYELLTGHRGAGIFLAIFFVLVIGMVDNLLKPYLMKSGMQMHGAIVFLSLIGGALAFGGVGLVAGPLAVTFFLAMVRMRSHAPVATP